MLKSDFGIVRNFHIIFTTHIRRKSPSCSNILIAYILNWCGPGTRPCGSLFICLSAKTLNFQFPGRPGTPLYVGLHFKRRIWPTHTTDSEHLIWQANLRMWEGGQREFRFTLQRCFRNTASRKLIALISLSLCVSFRPLSHSNQCLNSTDPIQDRMCQSTSDFRETWIMCGL